MTVLEHSALPLPLVRQGKVREVYEAGLLGVEWPEAYGGRGMPAGSQRVVAEEMSRARVPFMVNHIGLAWAGPTIMAVGTEEQKRRYLKPILSCEEVFCQGFSEPGAGSDLASLRTRAVRRGDPGGLSGRGAARVVRRARAALAPHVVGRARRVARVSTARRAARALGEGSLRRRARQGTRRVRCGR